MKTVCFFMLCFLMISAVTAQTTVQSSVVTDDGENARKISVNVDVVVPVEKEKKAEEPEKKSNLPWVIAVCDFVTIDSIALDGLEVVNKPVVVPELSTLTDADRASAHSVMSGLVLLAEAEDTAATNSVNRLSQIQDNEFAIAKAIAEYEQKIKEGVRNVVIGADLLCGELGNKPELFAFVDKDRFNKAAAAVMEKDELPENYLAELAGVTGATHAVYGTVSDLRTSVKKFTGYGITTENTLYELDLIIKVLDLNSGRIIYAKTSTGKVKVTNNNNVVRESSSDNFALALNDAVRQAGKELAAFVAKSDKK